MVAAREAVVLPVTGWLSHATNSRAAAEFSVGPSLCCSLLHQLNKAKNRWMDVILHSVDRSDNGAPIEPCDRQDGYRNTRFNGALRNSPRREQEQVGVGRSCQPKVQRPTLES